MSNPVFLLAFSYNPEQALPETVKELKNLQSILSNAGVEPIVIWQATKKEIEDHFLKHKENIRLFHYGGHAGKNNLQLNAADTNPEIVFSEGLAGFTGFAKCMRLVFLNGCSTADQAQYFLKHGAPAVIATTIPLQDRYALEFAGSFYQHFTNPRINPGLSLQKAFDAAWFSFLGKYGTPSDEMLYENVRGIYPINQVSGSNLYQLLPDVENATQFNESFSEWLKNCAEENEAEELLRKKNHIRQLVGKGNLDKALVLMLELVPDKALQMQSQFQLVNDQYYLGVMDIQDWLQAQAKISQSILSLLNQ